MGYVDLSRGLEVGLVAEVVASATICSIELAAGARADLDVLVSQVLEQDIAADGQVSEKQLALG